MYSQFNHRITLSKLSAHFKTRLPSAIRIAQLEFFKRTDQVQPVDTAIGNVSLPMHPAMQERMFNLDVEESPFKDGVVKYTATIGVEECREAFLNVIRASGFSTEGLYAQITDGGSQAMEIMILGCCGPAGTKENPLLVIDAAYANYKLIAQRVGRGVVSVARTFEDNEKFTLPDVDEIEKVIEEHQPAAMVVIPYDNPTGHFCDHDTMVMLAKLCVENNMWIVSDEAYRELHYTDQATSSIWGITEKEVPGITGHRISIDSSSKVWNGCGLRIGALITDNKEFHEKAVAENTASLCPNAIGQYIFGALAHENKEDLQKWFHDQREYYKKLMLEFTRDLKEKLPGIMISSPDASIYSVVDVKKIAKPGFDAKDFVLYCAREGKVDMNGKQMTLLVAPMGGFYNLKEDEDNPGKTQMRIAYVVPPEEMKLVPELFVRLFKQYDSI